MDALRNSKKISLLAAAILFLFTFFTLILDAPRIISVVLILTVTIPAFFQTLTETQTILLNISSFCFF